MSAPPRYINRRDGIIVDLFAGGGGASTGIEAATGRSVNVAINHSPVAIDVHTANHPVTAHYRASVWDVTPQEACKGRRVDILWASPDCTHFSVAKGGKPRKQNIRSLAEVVIDWAAAVRPSRIFVENVREFLTWGPLDAEGLPIKARAGELFERWKVRLELLGYQVAWKVLDASEFGAPTKRRRLFIVARCDGQAIEWPTPTHGPGLLPFRTAAECIDWSIPCPSIFERKRPLAAKTLQRIAAGIRKFVIENPNPFIIPVNHGGGESRCEPIDHPLSTVTAARRGHALVTPFVAGCGGRAGESAPTGGDQPVGTITAKNDRVLVAPTMITIDHQSSPSGSTSAEAPLPTTTTENRHALVAPTLIQTGYGERPGQRPRYLDLHEPLGTLMAQGQKHGLVTAFLAKHFGDPSRKSGGGVVVGTSLEQPIGTVTARDHHSLAAVTLATFRGTAPNQPMCADVRAPLPVITAGGTHVAEVRAFLAAYYGSGDVGQDLRDPLRTVVTKDRFGLVMVGGVEHVISDIGMRMLEPHELLRAQFGRFAAEYDLSAAKTKSDQVRLIGNSVCPEVAEAVVKANTRKAARSAA